MKRISNILRKLQPSTPVCVYGAVVLLVLGPLLLPGYVLTLDMVFTPVLRMPDQVSSSYLFRALLHLLDIVLPADLVQKVMLFAILLLTGLGMHRLMESLPARKPADAVPPLALYFAGLLYTINPFTYDRLLAGQYNVLFGYALLPWFVRALLKFVARPGRKNALVVAGWAVAAVLAA